MFDRKKVKEMQMTDEDYKSSNSSKNQREYENKVKKFLGYCQKFEKALVAENNLETVENIRTCFNSSFKDYYKISKKFSLFSHTTKILKGMDKALKKSGKLKLGDAKAVKNIKDAFKYARTNPTKDKDLIKRSAIDDKAVWKFFNSEIPKIIDDICSKNKEELDKLKAEKQDNLIPFIRKLLTELEKVEREAVNLKKGVEAITQKATEQSETLGGLENEQQDAEENVSNIGDDETKKKLTEVGNEIEDHKDENEENIEELNNVTKKIEDLNSKLKTLNGCLDEIAKNNLKVGSEFDAAVKEKLIAVGFNKDVKYDLTFTNKFNEKKNAVKKELENLEKEKERLGKLVKSNEKGVNATGRKMDSIVSDLEETDKLFKLEDKTLTINGQNGLKAYYDAYVKNKDFYKDNTTNIVMNNAVDVSEINAGNEGGLFSSFKNLTSVTAKGLKGTIGESAFDQCYNLSSFNSTSNNFYNIPEGVEIGISAFSEAGKDVASGFSANIGSKTIGEGAFSGSSLKEVNLPNATNIKENAFGECNSLTKVTLGGDDIVIGMSAFSGTGLTEIDLTKVANVMNGAFSGCESLATVTLGPKTTIGNATTFYNCGISKVTILKGNRTDDAINGLKAKILGQAKNKKEKTEENPDGIEFIIK